MAGLARRRPGLLRLPSLGLRQLDGESALRCAYVRWPAGDCLLVYPGPRSTIRFERLREGIADFEKIRIVREIFGQRRDAKATESLARLDAVLKRFTYAEAQRRRPPTR